MVTTYPINTIVSDPTIRNGRAVIQGTRVAVIDVVASYLYRELSPEELAVNYALDMGQVYAALAHYYQNKTEIDEQIHNETEAANKLLAEFSTEGRLFRLEIA